MAKPTKRATMTFERKCKTAGMTSREIKAAVQGAKTLAQIKKFVGKCKKARMSPDEIKAAVRAKYGRGKDRLGHSPYKP